MELWECSPGWVLRNKEKKIYIPHLHMVIRQIEGYYEAYMNVVEAYQQGLFHSLP